jgi:hypothetical protein
MNTKFGLRFDNTIALLAVVSVCSLLVCGADIDPEVKGSWPGFQRLRGAATCVAISGHYAYLAHGDGGLLVVDIADPTNPQWTSGYDTSGRINGLTVSGNYGYVTVGDSGLQVIDISDASHLHRVAAYDTGGRATSVVASGKQIYVAVEGIGLEIISISDPVNPRHMAVYPTGDDSVSGVAMSGTNAYVVTRIAGLQVIDVTNPATPQRLGGYAASPESPLGNLLAVAGNYAYVSRGAAGLEVIDISVAATPRTAGVHATTAYAYALAVSGKYAFLTEQPNWNDSTQSYDSGGLQVMDISDPPHLRNAGRYEMKGNAFGIAILGGHAYVAHGGERGWPGEWFGTSGLRVIDISEAANPQPAGEYVSNGRSSGVAVSGDLAFLADGGAGLQVIDISSPSRPRALSRFYSSGNTLDVALRGKYAYVANESAGLEIVDISNPAQLIRVGMYPTEARAVAVLGNYAYVVGFSFEIIDIADPANPKRVGRYATRALALGVSVFGNYAYIADYNDGLLIIDISNPAQPLRVGAYASGAGLGIALSGNYVYMAMDHGLEVVDISNPANPLVVSPFDASGAARAVSVLGTRAYVAGGLGLQMFDISIPAKARRIGGAPTRGDPQDIAVSGNFAYVADGVAGLTVLDFSRRANPEQLGRSATAGRPVAVGVSGDHAYVATLEGGLQVLDVTDLKNPKRVGAYPTVQAVFGVSVSGRYAAVGEGEAGLQLIDISNPANPQRVGGYRTKGYATEVVISSNNAYIIDTGSREGTNTVGSGMLVINISNPVLPRRVAFYPTAVLAAGLAVSGSRAYVMDEGVSDGFTYVRSTLYVIDIADPANPQLIGTYTATGQALGVAASGNYAYVADTGIWDGTRSVGSALLVIDLSNASAPRLLAKYNTADPALRVALSGNYAYVAIGAGVEVLDISNPGNPRRVGGNSAFPAVGLAVTESKIFVAAVNNGFGILGMLPFFKSITKADENLKLSWEGFGPARLQRRTAFMQPWEEVPGYEGTSTATFPVRTGPEFFQLVKP